MRVETPNARFPFPALDGAKCAKVQQLKVQSNWHGTFFLQLEMSGPNKKTRLKRIGHGNPALDPWPGYGNMGIHSLIRFESYPCEPKTSLNLIVSMNMFYL